MFNLIKKKSIDWLLRIRPVFIVSVIKRVLFLKREICKTPLGTFYIDPWSKFGRELFTKGIYEPRTISALRAYLRPGDIFIDLGANENYFSVIASSIVGDNGKVFAIEPQMRLQKIILKNLKLNKCRNVTILPVAVSDREGESLLYLCPDVNTGGSSLIRTTAYILPKQMVSMVTLSSIFNNQRIVKCDLLKVDIEGWEYEAILGSPELFKQQRIKTVYLQLHTKQLNERGLSPDPIVAFLRSCNYVGNDNTIFEAQ